jgi:hypothetical protein
MLVVAWEALYDAIPRLQAKENLAAYSVAVLSSPYLTEDGQSSRDSILDNWREVLSHGQAWLKGALRSGSDFSGPNTPAGATRDDKWFPGLHAVQKKLGEIVGLGLRS